MATSTLTKPPTTKPPAQADVAVPRGPRPPAWVWPALVAGAAVQSWFRPGRFFASGDVPPFVRSGIEPELTWLWNHGITATGSPSYTIARLVELWVLRGVSALGGSETLAQRVFYTLVVVFAVGAVAWCVAALTRSRAAVVASGLVVFLNPFWIPRLPNPLVLLVVGCLGLFTGVLVRVAQGRKRRATSFAVATLACSMLALNPPLLAVLAIWSAVVVVAGSVVGGPGGTKRAAWFATKALPLALVINSWWLVPLVLTLRDPVGFEITASTAPMSWAWTQVNNSIPNVVRLMAHWAWSRPEYVPAADVYANGAIGWALWVIPALVIVAPLFVARSCRRLAWTLLGAIAVCVFLSKGLHGPLSRVNRVFYDVVPVSYLFREPFSKLGPLLVVLYAVMIGLLVDGALARRLWQRARAVGFAAVALGAAALIAVGSPMWTGGVVPTTRPIFPSARVALPEWWRAAAEAIDRGPTDGKLLTLPLNDYYQLPTTWGYYGVDHTSFLVRRPVVQRLPGGYFSDPPGAAALMRQAEQAILNEDRTGALRLLEALGVTHVLVRGDLDLDMVGGRRLTPPDRFDRLLRRLPGIEHLRNFGPLSVYRVSAPTGTVTAFRRAVIAPPDPVATAALTASVASDVAVVTAPRSSAASAALPLGKAAVWPRPESGDSYLPPDGTSAVVVRQQGPRVVHGAVEDASFVLREVWTAGSSREPLVPGPALVSVPLDGQRPRALVVNGTVVPLAADGAAIQLPSGPAEITLLGYAPREPTISASGPSPLGDCNAKDDELTADQIGLSAVQQAGGVRLSARAHQACVSWALRGVEPGMWLHFHIDHRSVQGRPARLCLFDMVSRRCFPIAAPTSDAAWTRFDSVVHVPPDVGKLRVYAYADGVEDAYGSPAREASVTEYRRLEVARLAPITTFTTNISSVAPQPVHVQGPGTLTVRGPRSGDLLGEFGLLGDCNRYDARSATEAGLRVRRSAGAVELTASLHSACVFAPIERSDSSSILEVSFRYRSIRGPRQARVCVYEPAERTCLPLEPADGSPITYGAGLPVSPGSRTFRAWVRVPAGVRSLRLFLYADGAPQGAEPLETTTRYQQIAVRPVAPFTLVVLDPSLLHTTSDAPRLDAEWMNPARFSARVASDGRPIIVASHESAAPGWRLRSSDARAQQVTVQGYRSGWVLRPEEASSVRMDVRYEPAMRARWLIGLSILASALALMVAAGSALTRSRRARRT